MQQSKGIIKFFLVVMTVVCLLQVFYMYPTNKVERAADEYAKAFGNGDKDTEAEARVKYIDSMSSEKIFSIPMFKDYTYEDLKNAQLAYGLDLEGGMSVVLQVDLRDFIRSLANDSKDPTFTAALDNAKAAQANASSDYVTLFSDEFEKLAKGGTQLAPIFYKNSGLRDKINLDASNAEVISIVRKEANEKVSLTYEMLQKRIDKLGVIQPNVSLDAARDLIIVELPGIRNPKRAREFLQTTAKLEFWNVYRVTDDNMISKFLEADKKLDRLTAGETTEEIDDTPQIEFDTSFVYSYDSLGNVVDSTQEIAERTVQDDPFGSRGKLLSILNLNATNTGQLLMPLSVMGTAPKNKIETITKMLERPEIKSMFPRNCKFLWSHKAENYSADEDADPEEGMYSLYAINMGRADATAPLEGDVITDASADPNPQTQEIEVSLTMNSVGAKKWAQLTTKAANDNNREIAIVLDDRVQSAPRVNGAITGGRSSITGNFTTQEGNDLAKILQVGKLPAKTKIIQEALVGPSLGKENISRSLSSLGIGFLLVLGFMIMYYARGGIVSIIALFMNMFFIYGALASFGTVLTLPGIAGILLTIGMAVDANVIIYERIREELREGKTMLMAIKDGFQHSYSAIIDANVTTILVAIVLAYFGMGPIKGFAVVLIIGVISSLFTAVLVGRLMIDWWVGREGEMSFWTGFSKNAFANLKIDWLGKRKIAYMISGTIIVLGIISMAVRGFEYGVDFTGGFDYKIQFEDSQQFDPDDLRTSLVDVLGAGTIVKSVAGKNTYAVTTKYLIDSDDPNVAEDVIAKVHEGVSKVVPGIALSSFKNPDGAGAHVTSSSKIGPTIADDIQTSSIYATIFALLLIFLYIFIRFSKWQYSMGAVAALFHDVIIVLSVFSIFHGILPFELQIDQAFIAAILTVIGYSINDTVVVFDRIREFMGNYTKRSKEEVINMAINSTVSRTVITSLTTLFMVLMLFIFGSGSIKGFAFALVIGILVGTYSSIFVATPIVSDLSDEMKPKVSTKKSFSRANA